MMGSIQNFHIKAQVNVQNKESQNPHLEPNELLEAQKSPRFYYKYLIYKIKNS